jgi:hypothetical protein
MSQRQIQNPWLSDVFTTGGAGGHVKVLANARNTSTGASCVLEIIQAFKNVAGTLTLVGAATSLVAALGDAGMLTCVLGITSSGTTVQPQVTGIAATNIEWLIDARYWIN